MSTDLIASHHFWRSSPPNSASPTAGLTFFDFAVNEQCARYGECARLTPFVRAGKAVFAVEYELPTGRFCAASRRLGLSSMLKKYELGAWRRPC